MTKRIIITGASSGLGAEIQDQLRQWNILEEQPIIHDWSRYESERCVDITVPSLIEEAIKRELGQFSRVDILINCAGVNHIDWLGKLTEDDFDWLMNTNARSIFSVTKRLLPYLSGGTICNIVSNASHMPMTHSLAYNASKGAAHIMTLQMARELKKTHDITVFGVSPNKLKGTGMSQYIDKRVCELRGWTPEQAADYQRAALPAGEETDPKRCAEFIAFLLSEKDRHKFLNGCIIPYGA